jgi:hypothetical protein
VSKEERTNETEFLFAPAEPVLAVARHPKTRSHRIAALAAFFLLSTSALPATAAGYVSIYKPSATLTSHANEPRDIVFTSRGGHLLDRYYNGSGFSWLDIGAPPVFSAVGAPQALTATLDGNRNVWAFVMGSDNHLYVAYRANNGGWTWADQGAVPGGTALSGVTGTIWSTGTAASLRIQVFITVAKAGGGQMVKENYWNGSTWAWRTAIDNGTVTLNRTFPTATGAWVNGDWRTFVFYAEGSDGGSTRFY